MTFVIKLLLQAAPRSVSNQLILSMAIIKVAAVQASPVYYDLAKTLDKAIHFIESAAAEGNVNSALIVSRTLD